MKKLGIINGMAMSTTMENSTGKDWKYNINSDSCKLCYDIFGKRNKEQCAKCKAGAKKVTI
mgnify:CR=1 FL=1